MGEPKIWIKVDGETVDAGKILSEVLKSLNRPNTCVLCLAGEEDGSVDRSGGLHHIFSRARLPGKRNEQLLWNPLNIALSCQPHHQLYDKQPDVWVRAMIKLGFATEEDYRPYYERTNHLVEAQ